MHLPRNGPKPGFERDPQLSDRIETCSNKTWNDDITTRKRLNPHGVFVGGRVPNLRSPLVITLFFITLDTPVRSIFIAPDTPLYYSRY